MAGEDGAAADQAAHEIAVAPFGFQIDRRWRAVRPAQQVAQVDRGAEMARSPADQDKGVTGRDCAPIDRGCTVLQHADAADDRGRQDRLSAGLVVE